MALTSKSRKKKSTVSYRIANLLESNVNGTADFIIRDFDVGAAAKIVQFEGLMIPLKKCQYIKKDLILEINFPGHKIQQ